MRVLWLLTGLVAVCLTGCPEIFQAETASPDPGAQSAPPAQETPSPPAGGTGIRDSIASRIQGGPSSDAAGSQPPPTKPPTTPPPTGKPPGEVTERVKAEAGVAAAGRSLDNETGVARVIVQPVTSLYAFKENAVFKIQIPQALQLYKASEGRFPRSHEEFMTKIVRANNLRLPELPPGQRYVFDSQVGELMVERPAQ